MIKLHHYSKEKLKSFTPEKQVKAIVELLSTLEKNITDAEYVKVLTNEILSCMNWLNPALENEFEALHKLADSSTPHDILCLIALILDRYKPNQENNDMEIHRFDGPFVQGDKPQTHYPMTVILDNLRSAYNVGSIFRTAECVQIQELLLCGITPHPPNPKLSKTAMQTIDRLQWQYLEKTEDAIAYLKNKKVPVIALETTSNAISLFDYKVTEPVGLILGNEALGIEEHILKQADMVLSIPVLGWKNSLNVCNAFAIAGYWLSGISETAK